MKTFFLSKERLESLIEKLWEKGEENDVRFDFVPKDNVIHVVQNNTTTALITVLDVVDEYDIISELF